MRKIPACLAVAVLLACGGPAPPLVEDRYVGTWSGRSMLSPADTGIPWNMVLSVADSELAGTLTFAGTSLVPVGVRTLSVAESTLVQEIGPYYSPTAKAEVLTLATARLTSDTSIDGSFVMRPTAGGDSIMGTYRARRLRQ